jgi:outer membrane protein TolC
MEENRRALPGLLAAFFLAAAPAAAGDAAAPVRALSVEEAILRALRNNADLDIQRIQVDVAAAAVGVPDGDFDPRAFADGGLAKHRDPYFAVNPFGMPDVNPVTGLPPGLIANQWDAWTYDAGLRQLTPLGTRYEVRYGVARQTTEDVFLLNPSWTPSLTVSITQPLLRGLGIDVNRALVTIAREGERISREGFHAAAMDTAFSVEQVYWAYVFALESRKVAEAALRTAEDLVDVDQKKLDAGKVAPIELLVAKAGVASRKEALIAARNEAHNARDRLLRLTEPTGSHRAWDVEIVPLDPPRADDAPIDVEKAFEEAVAHRPEHLSLEHTLAADRARLGRAANDALPRLDLVGSWSDLGLGDTHHNSHAALLSGDYYDASIAVSVEVPLFNTTARANEDQASATLRQDARRLDALEQAIALDVRTAARDIGAARERIRAADEAVDLAQAQLREGRSRLELGFATSHDVLLFEQDLSLARTSALKARADHEIATARLARVTGASLERRNIRIEEAR